MSKPADIPGVAALSASMWQVLGRAPDMPVWQWLEKNVTLTERETATPGPFRTLLRPYVREPLEAFRNRNVTDLSLCWGTQTGKTMVIMGGAAYKIVNDAMNTLWVMPNADLCKSFSRNRWQPMVENCFPLKLQKPKDRFLWKTMEQFFHKTTLTFVGSNSPANLASRPAGLLLLDEIDKYELKGDKEAGALQNAEERTKTFPYPLRVKTSTPTTAHGEIWREFLSGDQRFFYVPCPNCKEMIRLEWANVRWWDKDESDSKIDGEWNLELVRRNTYYRCQHCEFHVRDGQKTAMLRDGEWRAHNLNASPGRRSYHLNSLYAALKETTWGNLAVKWLQTKSSMTRRHAFINSTLAEVWDDERATDDTPVHTTVFALGDLPTTRIPIMTIDCQEGHYWALIRYWGRGSESWLIWEGRVETSEELEALQAEHQVEPHRVGIDMAHRPNESARLIVKNGWRGLWGSDKKGFSHTLGNGARVIRDFSPVQYRDPHVGTVHQSDTNQRAMYIFWSNDRVKDRLEILRHTQPTKFHVPSTVSNHYIRQINSEIKMTRIAPITGRLVHYWKQIRKDNHLRDTELMGLAMALAGGILEDETMDVTDTQRATGYIREAPTSEPDEQQLGDEFADQD
jgi:hypothetical protein